MFFCYFSIFKQ